MQYYFDYKKCPVRPHSYSCMQALNETFIVHYLYNVTLFILLQSLYPKYIHKIISGNYGNMSEQVDLYLITFLLIVMLLITQK